METILLSAPAAFDLPVAEAIGMGNLAPMLIPMLALSAASVLLMARDAFFPQIAPRPTH